VVENEEEMSTLVPPHGGELKPLLLKGEELKEARKKARFLPVVRITSRERDDLIMMGIGAFSPLEGFMGKADWRGVCQDMKTANGVFWPIPITLSVTKEEAAGLKEGQEVTLVDGEADEVMGCMVIQERYMINKNYECKQVFRTMQTSWSQQSHGLGQRESRWPCESGQRRRVSPKV